MKTKLVFFSFLLIAFVQASSVVFAQTATPSATPITASPSGSLDDKGAKSIEEKTLKAVQERMKNSKAVGGTIIAIAGNTIKIRTENDQDYEVKVDEALTKVFAVATGQKKEIKANDLKKDSYIIATGVTTDKTINANFIYQDDLFVVGAGKISEVNKTDFYIKVVTTGKDTLTFDIESFTRVNMVNIKTLEPERIGFSKMKEGDTVHFVFKKTLKPQMVNRYPAQKIVLLPQEYFIGK